MRKTTVISVEGMFREVMHEGLRLVKSGFKTESFRLIQENPPKYAKATYRKEEKK